MNPLKGTKQGACEVFIEGFDGDIPRCFTNAGGFTKGPGYLISPRITGYEAQFYYNKNTTLDKNKINVEIELTSLNTVVGVGLRTSEPIAVGRIGEVDFINKKLIFRSGWDFRNDITRTQYEVNIPFKPSLNRSYKIELEKRSCFEGILTLTDMNTGDKVQIVGNEVIGYGWDGPSIIAIKGSFKVMKFVMINNQPKGARLGIYGDSFIEGASLGADAEKRYAVKIRSKLGGNCLISGRGGATVADLIKRLETDFDLFKPKYTLFAVGVNDSLIASFSTYKNNIEALINHVVKLGSEPILTTITRTVGEYDNLAFIETANPWIRSLGCKYIDFAKALSINYDGKTQNASLFFEDGIHPNIAGHEVMYEKALEDIKEVFYY